MLHTKFRQNRPAEAYVTIGLPVPEKKIFEEFYHIWAWRTSRSCDQHHVNKPSFPCT